MNHFVILSTESYRLFPTPTPQSETPLSQHSDHFYFFPALFFIKGPFTKHRRVYEDCTPNHVIYQTKCIQQARNYGLSGTQEPTHTSPELGKFTF